MQPVALGGSSFTGIESRAVAAASLPVSVEADREGPAVAPQRVAPSPSLRLHGPTGLVVVQILDPGSGEVRQQFPTERELKSYQAALAAGNRPAA